VEILLTVVFFGAAIAWVRASRRIRLPTTPA
jgi:uncharacterized membrane protein